MDDEQVMWLRAEVADLRQRVERAALVIAEEMRQCTSMICATIYVSFATGHDGDDKLLARLQEAMRNLLEPEPKGGAGV